MKVNIKGTIVSNDDKWIYDWLGYEATSPGDVAAVLEAAGNQDIEVEINSGGGDVMAAYEIYTAIRAYKGNAIITVIFAASAATIIMEAGKSQITPVGIVMIHNASSWAQGDYRDMDKQSSVLKTVDRSIMNAYIEKTGLTEEELTILMDEETWMTAQEAVEKGFIDSVMFQDTVKNQFSNSASGNIGIFNNTPQLSSETIEKLRSTLKVQVKGKSLPDNKPDAILNKSEEQQAFNINKNNINQGGTKMTLEEILNEHPEVQNEINTLQVTARQEGVTEERNRLQAIDNIAGSVPKDLVNKAKYTEAITASELALQVITANAASGNKYFNDALKDNQESGVSSVKSDPSDVKEEDDDEELINLMANTANSKRKAGK